MDSIERFAGIQQRELLNVGGDIPLLGESEVERHAREKLAATGNYHNEQQFRGGVYRLPGAPPTAAPQFPGDMGGGSPLVITAAARRAAAAAASRHQERLHPRGSFVDLHDDEMSPYVPRGHRRPPPPPPFDGDIDRSSSPPNHQGVSGDDYHHQQHRRARGRRTSSVGSLILDGREDDDDFPYTHNDNYTPTPRRSVSEPMHEDGSHLRYSGSHHFAAGGGGVMGRPTDNDIVPGSRHRDSAAVDNQRHPHQHHRSESGASFGSFAQLHHRIGGDRPYASGGGYSAMTVSARPTDNDFTRGSTMSSMPSEEVGGGAGRTMSVAMAVGTPVQQQQPAPFSLGGGEASLPSTSAFLSGHNPPPALPPLQRFPPPSPMVDLTTPRGYTQEEHTPTRRNN